MNPTYFIFPAIAKMHHVVPELRLFKRELETFQGYFRQLIRKKRDAIRAGSATGSEWDLLSMLVAANEESGADGSKGKLTDEELLHDAVM